MEVSQAPVPMASRRPQASAAGSRLSPDANRSTMVLEYESLGNWVVYEEHICWDSYSSTMVRTWVVDVTNETGFSCDLMRLILVISMKKR